MSLARRIVKGPAEAIAWGKKMREIRRAGKKTERAFFGPRGIIARRKKLNGEFLHIDPIPTASKKWPYTGVLKSPKGDVAMGYKSIQEAKDEGKRYGYTVVIDNPGEAWHEGMEHVAARYGRDARSQEEKLLFKGVEVAHRDSKKAARRMKMNPGQWRITDRKSRRTRLVGEAEARAYYGSDRYFVEKVKKSIKRKMLRNPLAVFGFANPPQRINTGIAGVIYNICHEIKAEKTGVKKGLYRHPFSRKSGVQILALDNGDLLIHSTRKVRLWKPF